MYGLEGISVLTSSNSSLLAVAKMATVIHKELPDSIIACGGIGASLRFKEFVNTEFIDLVERFYRAVIKIMTRGVLWLYKIKY